MTVNEAFSQFDEHLTISEEAREAAIELHHTIRKALKDAGVCASAILQGSFKRKTMLPPIRDVDMLGFINAEHRDLLETAGGSMKAARLVQDAIADAIPDAMFEITRHAVQVTISGYDFTFDLVPAFDRDDSELVDIANTEDDQWDQSNARLLNTAVSDRNGETNGRFIHQARMVRCFVKLNLEGIKGLDAESAAYHAITSEIDDSGAVTAALSELEDALTEQELCDPTGVDDLFARRKTSDLEAALPIVAEAVTRANEALDLEAAGDHNAAISIWRDLFGDEFPKPATQSEKQSFANSVGGSVASSGLVSKTSAGRTNSRATRSWRPE